MSKQDGFTIVEVMIAIMVLTVGLLSIGSTTAGMTRMGNRAMRSTQAMIYANERMETLRTRACTVRNDGVDTLKRSGVIVATNTWTFSTVGAAADSTYHLRLITWYKTARNLSRADTSETEFTCRI
jgi:prepilin-type N-terminal cleavage/methylation domain-containing protein